MVELSAAVWAFAIGVALFAGFVKGAIGFAMPLIMVSGLTLLLEPTLAVAALILPVVVSNGLQTFRKGLGPALDAVRSVWRYVLAVCVAIVIFAQLVPVIDARVFYLALGIPVVLISGVQLLGLRFRVSEASRWWSEWVVGAVSGVMGGLAGTWGPLTVLYLIALDMPKARQITVQGVIYGAGSVMLFVAHLGSGVLNAATIPFSAFLILPAMGGMWLGFRVHDRLNPDVFRKVVLAVLIVLGLNLIRRGVFG